MNTTRVEELFAAALERPAEQRERWVLDAADDPVLSSDVISLLRAHQDRGPLDILASRLGAMGLALGSADSALEAGLVPALADRYTIEREIGSGGMAIVYRARDVKHARHVAIKVLRPDLGALIGPERFLREIETTARLRHAHIVPLFDSGEAGGLLFYVMPLIEGETLRARLKRERRIAIEHAMRITQEVADALDHAHRHGVIHRDIKPENVMLEHGHAVVTDFGIARAIGVAGGEALTRSGVVLGTPQYMSPEQASGSAGVDARSDEYSLGCVVYEMLGGQPPFSGPTPESVIRQHVAVDPPPLSILEPDTPAHIGMALSRCLAKKAADRFASAGSFAAALAASGG